MRVMYSTVLAVIFMFVCLPLTAANALDRLIKPAEAMTAIEQQPVHIIDIRHKEMGFDKGHIPGSVSMPYWAFRGEGGSLVTDPEMTRMARQAGLRKEQPVLIVHSGMDHRSFSSAAWVQRRRPRGWRSSAPLPHLLPQIQASSISKQKRPRPSAQSQQAVPIGPP